MGRKSFFTADDEGRLIPGRLAMSLWGPDALNGPAVCAAAAHAAESAGRRDGFQPARFTLELFKSARRLPTTTDVRVLRDGRRIRVVEVSVLQHPDSSADEVLVARGTVVFLKQGTNPPGGRWQRPPSSFTPPSEPGEGYRPWFRTPERPWASEMAAFQNDERLSLWSRPFSVVPDEPLTPFQRAVIAGESTSLATNWGEGGIGFINGDLTVALARLPEGERIGLEADSHIESSGLSVGTANLYDEHGQFGIGLVTAIDNTAAMIDFTTAFPPSMSQSPPELN
ncbi:acyl-CoA thioesterase domain-containing protein [Gordonia shandongensis]|uniref:acyl-CoA thioesterase domain-containing protein n=1 Tax=Gordonia shandongensis TaxID=376351 RepID=UPI0004207E5C|nr:acyl-CoA thioesterase domain-containing protein [Gordonia shandongensis]